MSNKITLEELKQQIKGEREDKIIIKIGVLNDLIAELEKKDNMYRKEYNEHMEKKRQNGVLIKNELILKNEISALNQVHEYDVRMIDEVKGEAVRLYKMIDLMANEIKMTKNAPCNFTSEFSIGKVLMTKEEIIKYFENKVQE